MNHQTLITPIIAYALNDMWKFDKTITLGDVVATAAFVVPGIILIANLDFRMNSAEKAQNVQLQWNERQLQWNDRFQQSLSDEKDARQSDEKDSVEFRAIVNDRLNLKR